MQFLFFLFAGAAIVNAHPLAQPQAVTDAVSTESCSSSYSGSFGIAVADITTSSKKRSTMKRDGTEAIEIGDGQVQATTESTYSVVAVGEISDGQIQSTSESTAVSQISDGQPQAHTEATTSAAAVSEIGDGQVQHDLELMKRQTGQACNTSSTLELTLTDGVLLDRQGRTGYIASNYQLQFDDPPQAGALYTSGFSLCSNGSLALGDSAVFYKCLSGDFYNLYDRWWADQCSAVLIERIDLVNC